jgi:DNA-binding transcriptional LysR family regulator
MPKLNAFHLNGLRAVEAVARRGSLQGAADELGVSPSAVSQQLRRTEQQVGRALFMRAANGLTPTEFGRIFAARLSSGFDELTRAVALADQEASNSLLVSVAPALASKWLLPRLSRHFDRHPGVLLRIDASKRIADPEHSDVDVAIRLGHGKWPGQRAEKLLDLEIFPVSSPALASELREIADLARTWEIVDENAMFSWGPWFEAAGAAPVRCLPGAHFTDPMLCLDSVVAGHGVMLAWQLLAADALADGRLVAPFPIRAPIDLGYYVVTAGSRSESRNVKNFKAWLRDEIADTMRGFGEAFTKQGLA